MAGKIEDVEAAVRKILAEQLGVEESSVKMENLLFDLGVDSLDIVEIAMAAEEKFEIEIGDDILETLVTVQSFVDYIGKTMKVSS